MSQPIAESFRQLSIRDWRQFDAVEIDFHPTLTVLTGANAAGKSTILSLLARHFNWSRAYSPAPTKKGWTTSGRRERDAVPGGPDWRQIGSLEYSSGASAALSIPQGDINVRQQYDMNISGQALVTGLYLSSHRSIAGGVYTPVASIPTVFGSSEQVLDQFTNELRAKLNTTWTAKSPQLALKEALIAVAIFGEGSPSVESNPEALKIWTGFQKILAQVLPQSLQFKRLKVRVPDVIVETEASDFILDEASGGINALLELTWQIFLRSRNLDTFTVVIDEPENHLHPKLQRELMPSLIRAFPHVQYIVATHSPFVVTSSRNSKIYILDYSPAGQVVSHLLDYANKASTADETLQRVLGLESTLPRWAEDAFRTILATFDVNGASDLQVAKLRDQLAEAGLETQFPRAVLDIIDTNSSQSQEVL